MPLHHALPAAFVLQLVACAPAPVSIEPAPMAAPGDLPRTLHTITALDPSFEQERGLDPSPGRVRLAPRDCASATPCGDEALYRRALAHELAGRPEAARTDYLSILERWPASPYLPHAYFWLGEWLIAGHDPLKWQRAAASFRAALAIPGAPDALAAAARYRLAQALEQTEGRDRARQELKRLLADHPSSRAASLVPDWAR